MTQAVMAQVTATQAALSSCIKQLARRARCTHSLLHTGRQRCTASSAQHAPMMAPLVRSTAMRFLPSRANALRDTRL